MASLAEEYGVEISDIRYENDAQHFSSVVCSPKEEGSYPAVVYIHGLFGLQEMDVRFCARLAAEGYVVLAHDWQAQEPDPADGKIVQGIDCAVNVLQDVEKADASKTALIGVCRGGSITMVTGAKSSAFQALVSFYGQAYYPVRDKKKPVSPIDLAEDIEAPILVVHGEDDTTFSVREAVEYCKRLKALGKSYESRLYDGAEHGFFLQGHRNYHREASEDAWVLLKRFLRMHLA